MRLLVSAPILLALAGCVAVTAPPPPTPTMPSTNGTRVLDREALARLLANKGVTLQWLSWDQRGTAFARMEGERVLLTASQAKGGPGTGTGRLFLDGEVTEIGRDYFTFRGTIRIRMHPTPAGAARRPRPGTSRSRRTGPIGGCANSNGATA